MTAAKRTLEEIFEEHLSVTKAGFDRFNSALAEAQRETNRGLSSVRRDVAALREETSNGFAAVGGELADSFSRIDGRLSALERAVAALKP
jgi:hypothetical protein